MTDQFSHHWTQRWSHFWLLLQKEELRLLACPLLPAEETDQTSGCLGCGGKGLFSIRGSAPHAAGRPKCAEAGGMCFISVRSFSALSTRRSTSMFDMRCEEEAAVQPHSRSQWAAVTDKQPAAGRGWQMAGCECWGHRWAAERPRCPAGQEALGAENQNQIGWEPRAERPQKKGVPGKRLQIVNTAHVGIKESLLKFGQKAEGSAEVEATSSVGCQRSRMHCLLSLYIWNW